MRNIEVYIEKEYGANELIRSVEFFRWEKDFDKWLEEQNMECVRMYDEHDYWHGEGRIWVAWVKAK